MSGSSDFPFCHINIHTHVQNHTHAQLWHQLYLPKHPSGLVSLETPQPCQLVSKPILWLDGEVVEGGGGGGGGCSGCRRQQTYPMTRLMEGAESLPHS